MRPTVASGFIKSALKIRISCMIWGGAGVGKSSVVRQIANELGRKLVDIRLSLVDPTDLRGFPYRDGNTMRWAPACFLPQDRDATDILFLDEVNSAPPAVQAAAYQLILDRKIGEYILPDGVSVVAAGNRETDRGVTFTMAAPLANRFLHIDPFEVNFDDWRAWAMQQGLRPEVVNFINYRPALLNDFDGTKKAFPTPRTWEFVHRVLEDHNPMDVERAMVGGAVGEGAGAEFAGFLKIFRSLPNPDVVLMNPKTAEVPTDPATLYALCGALSARASEANFDRLIQYCGRMKPEFQVLTIRDSVKRTPDLAQMQAFTTWAIENHSVLI